MTRKTLLPALAACLLIVHAHADAQSYPVRPIRLIVPYPPGGGSDLVGRVIAQGLTTNLGQQVVIDNRSGAQGGVGTAAAARATPQAWASARFSPASTLDRLSFVSLNSSGRVSRRASSAGAVSGMEILGLESGMRASHCEL